jgi:hypothetical protein
MKVTLPVLDLQPDVEVVKKNRQIIKEARAALKSALKALEGLENANTGMCPHPRTEKRYDPGWGGGGYSHTECLDCGGHLL